ncbi:MAG: DNA (cytosine-5-)-methyltransferase [Candidatus Saccharibacteria bacterium]|nr:DNA (cytosine-5-)-methyltransferase [Candidatus Saccharibacteria bacterium]
MKKTVCELFAGVGGFRVGLERLNSGWSTVWFSQWEPGASKQWAHECYVSHFGDIKDLAGEYTTGIDVAQVNKKNIPDHTLVVGGFPCQDYSVAHTLASSKGLQGKKGVLWWQIYEILKAKKTPFCLFENVDRLLKSPAKQRGRDFGVMLSCLHSLGYVVEWRVINAAEYGAAQRRRRTFIFAYNKNTNHYKTTKKTSLEDILLRDGFFASTFPIRSNEAIREGKVSKDVENISNDFKFDFGNAGIMRDGKIVTTKATPMEEKAITLGKILENKKVDDSFFISDEKMPKWTYLKGAKRIERTSAAGYKYVFSEGPIAFPDPWDKPSRTMLTSESTLNRSTHVVEDRKTKKLRLITPIEAERLQGFEDNWTNTGMPQRMRYFCMGNALVTHMITRMGRTLDNIIDAEE